MDRTWRGIEGVGGDRGSGIDSMSFVHVRDSTFHFHWLLLLSSLFSSLLFSHRIFPLITTFLLCSYFVLPQREHRDCRTESDTPSAPVTVSMKLSSLEQANMQLFYICDWWS